MTGQAQKYGRLVEHLLERQLITEASVQNAQALQAPGQTDLTKIMVEHDLITDVNLARGIASFFRFPLVNLTRIRVARQALEAAKGEFCRRNQVLPFGLDQNSGELLVAVSDPSQVTVTDALRSRNNQNVRAYVAPRGQLRDAIEFYYFGAVPQAKTTASTPSPAPAELPKKTPATPNDLVIPSPSAQPSKADGAASGVRETGRGGFQSVHSTAPKQPTTAQHLATPVSTEDSGISSNQQGRHLAERVAKLEDALEHSINMSRALAEILVENGLISQDQLKRRLED